ANFHYDRTTWYDQFAPPIVDSPFLRFPGVKITLDQEWGETIFFDQPTLNEMVEHADAGGWQVATHSFSLRANDLILNAYEAALQGQDSADRRHRLEHTGIISDDQLEKMKRLGIIASVGLGGTPFMPDDLSFQRSVPAEQWPWMVRTRDFLNAGIFTAGHTDTPWGSVDWRNGVRPAHAGSVMWALHAAVTRNDASWPRPPEPWQVAQTISVEEAMRLLTIYAAYASFDEDRLGSLAPGKLADLVVLSANPLQVAVEDIPQIDVLMTMIGGRAEYCAPGTQAWCTEGG
ncbi:MAG: amidohydrolase family protein, partial [Chloroflexi bacterium]|nr:amidohydrolase family protein [Chloroflexota bacterium]